MNRFFTFLLLLTVLITSTLAKAQVELCATDIIHQERLASDPEYKATFERMQADLRKHIARKKANPTQRIEETVYTIPVVVHVIHTGEDIGTEYNPSDADINTMITTVNDNFRATSVGTDIEIEFVLAKRDPNCIATTGIIRIDASSNEDYNTNGVKQGRNGVGAEDIDIKNLSRWSNTDYYNIWIVKAINGEDGTSGEFTAGYANFPNASADVDGTVILATQINNRRNTMTHELGHAFFLYHTFQGANEETSTCALNDDCNEQGDLICDTDPHLKADCDATSCNEDISLMTRQNIMTYCPTRDRFTPDQKLRMRTVLETQRSGLISSLGGTAPANLIACSHSVFPSVGNQRETEFTWEVQIVGDMFGKTAHVRVFSPSGGSELLPLSTLPPPATSNLYRSAPTQLIYYSGFNSANYDYQFEVHDSNGNVISISDKVENYPTVEKTLFIDGSVDPLTGTQQSTEFTWSAQVQGILRDNEKVFVDIFSTTTPPDQAQPFLMEQVSSANEHIFLKTLDCHGNYSYRFRISNGNDQDLDISSIYQLQVADQGIPCGNSTSPSLNYCIDPDVVENPSRTLTIDYGSFIGDEVFAGEDRSRRLEELGRRIYGENYSNVCRNGSGTSCDATSYFIGDITNDFSCPRGSGQHTGVDLGSCGLGYQTYSPVKGEVISVGGTFGTIAIYIPDYDCTYISLHHTGIAVNVGDQVEIGTYLGLSGNASNASIGIHTHSELRAGRQTSANASGAGGQNYDPLIITELFKEDFCLDLEIVKVEAFSGRTPFNFFLSGSPNNVVQNVNFNCALSLIVDVKNNENYDVTSKFQAVLKNDFGRHLIDDYPGAYIPGPAQILASSGDPCHHSYGHPPSNGNSTPYGQEGGEITIPANTTLRLFFYKNQIRTPSGLCVVSIERRLDGDAGEPGNTTQGQTLKTLPSITLQRNITGANPFGVLIEETPCNSTKIEVSNVDTNFIGGSIMSISFGFNDLVCPESLGGINSLGMLDNVSSIASFSKTYLTHYFRTLDFAGYDIYLSLDDGLSYERVAQNITDNSYDLELPNISVDRAKYKVTASNNTTIYGISDAFSITERTENDCPAGGFVTCPVLTVPICPNEPILVRFQSDLPITYYPIPQRYELQIFLDGAWQGMTAQYSATEGGFQAVVPADIPAGVYQLRVRANPLPNNLGYVTEYTNTTPMTVNPNPVITLSVNGTPSFCNDEIRTITATASDADSYQWLRDGSIINGATARTYIPTVSGRYSVVITTTKGCQSESEGLDIIVVEQNDVAITAASSTTICVDGTVNFTNNSVIRSQGSGTMTVVNTTTGSIENIAITTPDADMQYQFLEAGIYEIKYSYESDGGECLAESSIIQVTVLEAPKNPILKDQNGNSTTTCETSALLSVQFDGQGTPLYKWLKNGVVIAGAVNSTYTATEAGVYQVELSTQENGVICSSLTNEFAIVPKAISNVAPTDTTYCLGVPMQLRNFTAVPTGAVSVLYSINLGDGNVSSNPTASHLYSSEGVYTISISVTTTDINGLQCVDTQQHTVRIVKTTPNFTASQTEICEGEEIQFNATTVVDPNDNLVSQSWDFGNGQTSSIRNPSMAYLQTGTYTVRLTVNTAAGCTYSYEQVIEVKPKPQISLALSSEICVNQPTLLIANFSNTTANVAWTINGNVVNGGNGGQLPYTFGTAGVYVIEATATSYLGCETTVSQTITVAPTPVVDILAPTLRGCEGDEFVFENNTPLNISSLTWKLDGVVVATSGQVYRNIFNTAGTYQITLIVDNGICEAEKTIEVIIYPKPTIDFTYIGACADNEIVFTSQTNSSNLTYLWIFGDGTTSQLPNPRHTYNNTGSYLVELKVTNLEGCEKVIRKQVIVEPRLQANFNYSFIDDVICNPSVEFQNTSTINTTETVLYEWDFGDGTTSFEESPIHTFRNAGNYTIKLKLILPDCETEIERRITIKPSPTAQIEGDSLLCRDNSYTFSSSSLTNGGTAISDYKWKIFSNSVSYTYENQNSVSFIPPTSGEWKIQLEVMNLDSCWSESVKTVMVQPSPVLDITMQGGCIGQPSYILLDFEGTDIDQSSVVVTTSDGATYNASDRLWHTFQSSLRDSVFVTAEATNSYGCSYKLTKAFPALFAPVAALTLSNNIVCQDQEVTIINESFNSTITIADWGDGTQENVNTQATHSYSQSGEYDIRLITSHRSSSCSDTIVKTITVKPKAQADFRAESGCINNQYKFIPSSLNDEPLTSFVWITNGEIFSTQREPTYQFDSAGTYIMKLVATSGDNCSSDTVTREVLVKPSIVIKIEYDSVCVGKMIQLFDKSVTQLNAGRIVRREWDFGNGYISSLVNPTYTWTTAGEKQIHYRIFTEEGCELDTILTIRVGKVPSATFKLIKQPTSCDARSIFTYTGQGGKIKHWYINEELVGDTDTLILEKQRGSYKITLAVESAGGCVDTLETDYLHSPTPQPVVQALNYSDFCQTGDSVLVNVHPNVEVEAQHSWVLLNENGDSVTTKLGDSVSFVLPRPKYEKTIYRTVLITEWAECFGKSDTIPFEIDHQYIPQIEWKQLYENEISNSPLDTVGITGMFEFSNNTKDGDGLLYSFNFGDGDSLTTNHIPFVHTFCIPTAAPDNVGANQQMGEGYKLKVQAIDPYGCVQSLDTVLTTKYFQRIQLSTNTISLDGNNLNDEMRLLITEGIGDKFEIESFELLIYDANLSVVFSTNDYNFVFEGNFSPNTNPITLSSLYHFKMRYVFSDGEIGSKEGILKIYKKNK